MLVAEDHLIGERVMFERRFQGFTAGALGGYAAGVSARRIAGPAEANLRTLPLLDRELSIEVDGDRAVLRDGETVVIEVAAREFELQIPAPPTLAIAEAASRDPIMHEHEQPYADCFTCGTRQTAGDSLRLFMGRAPGPEPILAAAWTPDPRLAPSSELPTESVWAALDCPTISASWLDAGGRVAAAPGTFSVLARQRVERLAPVPLGQPAIVSAWPIATRRTQAPRRRRHPRPGQSLLPRRVATGRHRPCLTSPRRATRSVQRDPCQSVTAQASGHLHSFSRGASQRRRRETRNARISTPSAFGADPESANGVRDGLPAQGGALVGVDELRVASAKQVCMCSR